jgi:phage shock protein E
MSSLKEIVNNANTTVVDVRNTWEFEEGHYEGALNIPLDQIPQRLDEFKKMEGAIVLYCRSGNRSGMALQLLKQQGLDNLYNGGGVDEMLSLA